MPLCALPHIAASQMLANGADITAIADQLGHKNISITGSFSIHALASSQRRAALALPECTELVRQLRIKMILINILFSIITFACQKEHFFPFVPGFGQVLEGTHAESLLGHAAKPSPTARRFLFTLSFQESVMEMFPVMLIVGACMIFSILTGIYGVRKYN